MAGYLGGTKCALARSSDQETCVASGTRIDFGGQPAQGVSGSQSGGRKRGTEGVGCAVRSGREERAEGCGEGACAAARQLIGQTIVGGFCDSRVDAVADDQVERDNVGQHCGV